MKHSRRRFLVGAGGLMVGLPWLEKLHGVARAQQAGPRRVIAMAYSMGIPGRAWRPDGATGFNLPYVTAPLQPFVDRCLFVSNIDHEMLDAGGNAFVHGHPGKTEAALTGTLTTGAFPSSNDNLVTEVRSDGVTDGPANGPSIEQLIGEHLMASHPRSAVNLAVDGYAGLATWGPPEATATSRFFFESGSNAVTLAQYPHAAFHDLFAGITDSGPSEADLAMQRLRARNQSVLDAVRASFTDLAQGLGREDRRRLDEHAARIRQLELDVRVAETCSAPTGLGPDVSDYSGYTMDRLATLQIRNLAHAMACDMAPIGRLEFTNAQNPRFGIATLDDTLNVTSENGLDWHGMVHGDPIPGTTAYLRPGRGDSNTPYDQRLLDGYRFHVEQFAQLMAELDQIPEGPDQSALDNTLLVLASDLGEGLGHGNRKMGYIVAGNLGGARAGYHLDASPGLDPVDDYYRASNYNVNQLLNGILDMAGVVDGSGNPVTMGLQGWLEQRGFARRIDELFS
ncbi:MAG: DUF1552 domain-containing protein [Myxococcales bacterium]|nr:DUF1552 domain-containing protein [Myxococcales bacterium]MDD9968131.1 DUF1552 domain-containing protein [Myxococcales bacterium]